MKKAALLLIISALLLSSCSRLLNEPRKSVTIHTTQPAVVVVNNHTDTTRGNKVHLSLLRSNRDLRITTITDSVRKTTVVFASRSTAYYGNILTYGVGFFFDRGYKTYAYPSHIYIDPSAPATTYSPHKPLYEKGETYLHIGVPYINSFILRPTGAGKKVSDGFLGLSLGIDYYHSSNQYLSISTNWAMDFPAPVPAPVKRLGTYYDVRSSYGSISNNHNIRRFIAGYGIALASNRIIRRNDTLSIRERQITEYKNTALGLHFSTHYLITPHFRMGVVYRPTFIGLTGHNRYEHLVSFDLAWKIRL